MITVAMRYDMTALEATQKEITNRVRAIKEIQNSGNGMLLSCWSGEAASAIGAVIITKVPDFKERAIAMLEMEIDAHCKAFPGVEFRIQER